MPAGPLNLARGVHTDCFRALVQLITSGPDFQAVFDLRNVHSWRGLSAGDDKSEPAAGEPWCRFTPRLLASDRVAQGVRSEDLAVDVEISVPGTGIDVALDAWDRCIARRVVPEWNTEAEGKVQDLLERAGAMDHAIDQPAAMVGGAAKGSIRLFIQI